MNSASLKKYFDAHVCLGNFGSRAPHLRIPLALLDREEIRPYEHESFGRPAKRLPRPTYLRGVPGTC